MYKDSVITAVSDLSFHGKVLIWYLESNTEKVAIKFTLNKDKSITGATVSPNSFNFESLDFKTINELKEYLEKIRDSIYLIQVA